MAAEISAITPSIVVAFDRTGEGLQRRNAWIRKFPTADNYSERVDAYGAQIVNDLWPAKTGAGDQT